MMSAATEASLLLPRPRPEEGAKLSRVSPTRSSRHHMNADVDKLPAASSATFRPSQAHFKPPVPETTPKPPRRTTPGGRSKTHADVGGFILGGMIVGDPFESVPHASSSISPSFDAWLAETAKAVCDELTDRQEGRGASQNSTIRSAKVTAELREALKAEALCANRGRVRRARRLDARSARRINVKRSAACGLRRADDGRDMPAVPPPRQTMPAPSSTSARVSLSDEQEGGAGGGGYRRARSRARPNDLKNDLWRIVVSSGEGRGL